ncbi:hypothetical protein GRAN_2481 [Granulicella sibirica]|uniref:Uncharacterized protein n=1 Tax=Granulicella sibirica TaxID=2479048 RepID=A0A4V1L5F9_9BACT|nr:hypothetical protein GRAN_2481 [Granulicella sibirica]
MIELRSLANDRQHCGRCAPQLILRRVAGIAFNFSLVEISPASEKDATRLDSPCPAPDPLEHIAAIL